MRPLKKTITSLFKAYAAKHEIRKARPARPGALQLNRLLYLFQCHAPESALLSQYVGLGQGCDSLEYLG